MDTNGSIEQLTTTEVAQRLGISRNTVLQRVTYGRLKPLLKLPGRTGAYLFDAEEIDKIAASKSEVGR